MLEKYGAPAEATPTRLIWFNNGPWKRTIILKEETPHNFPMPHMDVMEQVINYRVPPDKFDNLARYDGSVIVERTRGEMSARCDKEEANFLALNLAHDIISGRRGVVAAREFYAEQIQELMAGRKGPYVTGLIFDVPRGNVGFRDRALIGRQSANER